MGLCVLCKDHAHCITLLKTSYCVLETFIYNNGLEKLNNVIYYVHCAYLEREKFTMHFFLAKYSINK